jgi:hypothetical protein
MQPIVSGGDVPLSYEHGEDEGGQAGGKKTAY